MRSLASFALALVLLLAGRAWGGVCTGLPNGTACTTDGNPCTNDVCAFDVCVHTAVANGAACTSDGDACTSDTCISGSCANWPICTDDCPCSAGPVRVVASCTDATPNTAAVLPTDARAFRMTDRSPAYLKSGTNAGGFVWHYAHASSTMRASVSWWAYDSTAALWVVATKDALVPPRTLYASTILGPLTLYPQIVACSEAVGAGFTFYAATR
jgi:hypothetical protein